MFSLKFNLANEKRSFTYVRKSSECDVRKYTALINVSYKKETTCSDVITK